MRQQPQLTAMIKGQVFDGFLLVRSATQRTSSNGSKYLDMTLCDISGEVNAKMWDGLTPPPPVAQVIRLRGMMLEYNGRPQLRVDKMRAATDEDDYDMDALTPCAPYPPGQMLDYILNKVDAFSDPQLKALVLKRLEECGDKLTYYPAASKLHHAERSGLLHHTSTMLRAASAICKIYTTRSCWRRGSYCTICARSAKWTRTKSAWSATTPPTACWWATWCAAWPSWTAAGGS